MKKRKLKRAFRYDNSARFSDVALAELDRMKDKCASPNAGGAAEARQRMIDRQQVLERQRGDKVQQGKVEKDFNGIHR